MNQLELSSDEELRNESDKKSSTMTRLQQESESFLASLHSTPELSSTLQTVVPSKKSRQQSKHVTQKFSGLTKYSQQDRSVKNATASLKGEQTQQTIKAQTPAIFGNETQAINSSNGYRTEAS